MRRISLISLLALSRILELEGVSHLRDQCDISIDHIQKSNDHVLGFKAQAARDPNGNSVHHVFKEVAAGLSTRNDLFKMDRTSLTHVHEIIFHLREKNQDELKLLVHDISDPKSANYGKHKTRQEVSDMTSNALAHDFVLHYLKTAGAKILSETLSGEFITSAAPISLWEEFFDTEFFTFHHIHESKGIINKVVRAERYSIPAHLDVHVASVFNTIQMPLSIWAQPIVTPVTLDAIDNIHANVVSGFIDPAVLKAYYNIGSDIGNSQSTQAVFETIGQYYSPADLKMFQDQFGLQQNAVAVDIGGHSSDKVCRSMPKSCVESNLDVQYIMAISQLSPTTQWYTNLNSFANWLVTVANMVNPPLVISISYGANENEISRSEFDTFNMQAIKLAAMGVTILVASGDDGASSYLARFNRKNCGYRPLFPATSPYVIAVGGTQGPEFSANEITCQSDLGGGITSGGGFSTYYPRPYWQSNAIERYFTTVMGSGNEPVRGYNRSGRAYPDLAVAASNYLIIVGGRQYALSGTSAAAPVVAGMFSLVNAARLKVGKSSLGWINPVIYANYMFFTNDVLLGVNNCTAGSPPSVCCKEGFHATLGWDPTTGFGSLNFAAFKDFFLNKLPIVITVSPTSRSTIRSFRPTPRPTYRPSPQPTRRRASLPTISPTRRATLMLIPGPFDGVTNLELRPQPSSKPSSGHPSYEPTPIPSSVPTNFPTRIPPQGDTLAPSFEFGFPPLGSTINIVEKGKKNDTKKKDGPKNDFKGGKNKGKGKLI